MSTTLNRDTAFLNRFHLLWARKRRIELGQVAVSSLLLALLGLGGLAIADYSLELDRSVRVIAFGAMLGAVALFAINSLWRTVRQWSQPTTAVEIEAAFPQLGQSVRTTVQFGAMRAEQVQSEGVATTLVTALAEQTHQRALPLTIEDVVPAKKLGVIACGLAAGVVLLAGASSVDWQWLNATSRAVLQETPYRQLEVRPGDQTVDEGTGLRIDVALIGRTNREVTLFTRPAGDADAEWTERKLETSEGVGSPVYQVGIRRPLRIEEVKVELTPPSYTGQPTCTSLDLNLSVLQGTLAKFVIQFDKPVKSASLVFAPRKQPRDDEDKNEPEIVPLAISHVSGTALAAGGSQGGSTPRHRWLAPFRSKSVPLFSSRSTKTVTTASSPKLRTERRCRRTSTASASARISRRKSTLRSRTMRLRFTRWRNC